MTVESSSIVDRIYKELKDMTISYVFKPGERINEVELAATLKISRTPLREALNRLNTEGFLTFVPGKGFFCRQLDVKEIFELYELRNALERSAVALSIKRAKDEDIESLRQFLNETGPGAEGRTTSELVTFDEIFHERLIAMSDNAEFLRVLRNVNARIRFVRWIDMDGATRSITQSEHRRILDLLHARDEQGCVEALGSHVERRTDQITAFIKEGYSRLYMREAPIFDTV